MYSKTKETAHFTLKGYIYDLYGFFDCFCAKPHLSTDVPNNDLTDDQCHEHQFT